MVIKKMLTMRFVQLTFLLFLWTFFIAAAPSSEQRCDLEGDGRLERIIFRPQTEGAVVVLRGRRKVWQGVPQRWKAWKLLIADVDGDGKKEFLLGVNIRTRYFPQRHKSIFVLGWNGKYAYARWLGSHMSKPLLDFMPAELDGECGDEVVTLEVTSDGKRCLLVYKWCGFGFWGIWQSPPFARARLIRVGQKIGVRMLNGHSLFLTRKGDGFVLGD